MRRLIATFVLVLALGACTLYGEAPTADASSSRDGDASATADAATTVDGGGADADGDATAADAATDVSASPDACNGVAACKRYVFVTSAATLGDFGFANADAICAAAASSPTSKPELKGRAWRAWLSIVGNNVASRIPQGTAAYRRPDGVIVAGSYGDLLDGYLVNPIDVDETGAVLGSASVWTGTNIAGQAMSGLDCAGWTSSSTNAKAGDAASVDSKWTDAADRACSSAAHLYCIEY